MKQIPLVPSETLLKDDKVSNRIAHRNPKTYDGKCDLVKLKEWIRGIEKVVTVVEVPKEKKMNIRTFNLTRDACLVEHC